MGAWGPAITSDDLVMDIISCYKDALKRTQSTSEARVAVENSFHQDDLDPEERHLFWIALAEVQWKYGALEDDVLSTALDVIDNGVGLELWREEGEKELQKRVKVLEAFRDKLNRENPKPLKIPKLIKRKVLFAGGDCLSIRKTNGSYLAGIVKRVYTEEEEYPSYLIQLLDWCGDEPPTESVFIHSKELVVDDRVFKGRKRKESAWYINQGFRSFKDRIIVVCSKPELEDNNEDSRTYSHWEFIVE